MMRSRFTIFIRTLQRHGKQCLAFGLGLLVVWSLAEPNTAHSRVGIAHNEQTANEQTALTRNKLDITPQEPSSTIAPCSPNTPVNCNTVPKIVSTNPRDRLATGRTYYQQGRYADAQRVWEAAREQFAQNGDRPRQALSLSYLAMVQQDLGDWSAAEIAIAQSLTLAAESPESFPAIVLAHIWNTQASLQFNQSQFQRAHQTWQQAATYYTEAGDQLGAWGTQINQAQALKELGFYRRATQALIALNAELAELPDSELKLAGLQALGGALQVMGNLTESEAVLQEGLRIARQFRATEILSRLHLQIGRIALQQDEPDRALTAFQTAATVTDSPVVQLQTHLELLSLYRRQTNWSDAAAIAPQIAPQLATLPPSRTQLYGVINLVYQTHQFPPTVPNLSLAQQEILLQVATTTAEQFQDQRAIAHLQRERGKLYAQAQKSDAAIAFLQQSVNLARGLQANDVLAQSAWQLGRQLKATGRREDAIAAYTEAVKTLQAIRGDLVAINQDLQFSFREGVEPIYRELISLLLAAPEPSQTELEQARRTLEDLQLAELDNYFQEACADVATQTIDQVDPAATVFYPIILPDKLAVIVAQARQPLHYYQTAISQAQLEAHLDQFLMDLHPAADYGQRTANAQQLYDWLIRPARDLALLTNTQTLVFVLDGLLRNIPMATLQDGEQYLIEQYAIAISPGLQLLQGQPLSRGNLDAVIGGISEARGPFRALPEVTREVQRITQQTDATTLLNAEFTSAAIRQAVQTRPIDVVHFATHGQFSSNPEDTFFLTWEGRINVRELAEILQNRQRAQGQAIELLVLSACDTATGDDRATLGLAGLAVKSGVRSTIATLWPIRDQIAAQLMIDFYEQLLTPGVTRAEALRQAQLRLLAQPNYRDPFFWSPYTLVGNWQ